MTFNWASVTLEAYFVKDCDMFPTEPGKTPQCSSNPMRVSVMLIAVSSLDIPGSYDNMNDLTYLSLRHHYKP